MNNSISGKIFFNNEDKIETVLGNTWVYSLADHKLYFRTIVKESEICSFQFSSSWDIQAGTEKVEIKDDYH